jgi:hypothetical protein
MSGKHHAIALSATYIYLPADHFQRSSDTADHTYTSRLWFYILPQNDFIKRCDMELLLNCLLLCTHYLLS